MKIYISGKITGMEIQEAEILFEIAEINLRNKGFKPINPMKINHNHNKTWQSYMKEDLKALLDCEAIFMLSNWEQSRGARIEHDLALNLGLKMYYNLL
jgi:hypothetical protein